MVSNPGLDLERELTCSICTELLYHPLTLLDCLHTFCGSCLKEWFAWQLTNSRNNPSSRPPGSIPFTCPSCRAGVRETKHNATVTTLLDMFLSANPNKGRTEAEKEECKKKYAPGENVIPQVEEREKTLRERRLEDHDRNLLNEIRDLSLREVGVETHTDSNSERRRRRVERSRDPARRSSRDPSRDSRNTEARDRRRADDEQGRERRRHRHDTATQGTTDSLRPETDYAAERRRRRSNEEARRRQEESHRASLRQIEHQASLRSLISSSDLDSHEMEEEILRQIQEEGLLDGIDLENIDVNQEDEISERIAEAFRRRQREKAEQRRTDGSSPNPVVSAPVSPGPRRNGENHSSRASSGHRVHSRSPSSTSQEISRPNARGSTGHLDVYSGEEHRRRRRTTSGGRRATSPIPTSIAGHSRPAARSQTDLSERPRSSDFSSARPAISTQSRSTTEPARHLVSEAGDSQPLSGGRTRARTRLEEAIAVSELSASALQTPVSSASFVPSSTPSAATQSSTPTGLSAQPPSPRQVAQSTPSERALAMSSAARPTSSSSTTPRSPSARYAEPNLTCSRCAKPHIEYELHFNCAICYNGNWNICLSCYRSGKGCLHWFGFGDGAWRKWNRLTSSGELSSDSERPHMLTANRYVPPKTPPGGADGRRTLTSEDPQKRLQSGAFCTNCFAWANECYWRCEFCNEADWGYCNNCVNQGKHCTHPLLPLLYQPDPVPNRSPPSSPSYDNPLPPAATVLTGPGVINVGSFKPLSFRVACDICHYPIQPSASRYHCFYCTSSLPGCQPGDYDLCSPCYLGLITKNRISSENGPKGWRRCLNGHRMVMVGFEEGGGGQRRIVVNDLVGGRCLREEQASSIPVLATLLGALTADLQVWSWEAGGQARLVTSDVASSAPTPPPPSPTSQASSPPLNFVTGFPQHGGRGMRVIALWSWYPKEGEGDGELLFPKGAEIREVVDVNGDWCFGVYMGQRGLFPAPYVRILDRS